MPMTVQSSQLRFKIVGADQFLQDGDPADVPISTGKRLAVSTTASTPKSARSRPANPTTRSDRYNAASSPDEADADRQQERWRHRSFAEIRNGTSKADTKRPSGITPEEVLVLLGIRSAIYHRPLASSSTGLRLPRRSASCGTALTVGSTSRRTSPERSWVYWTPGTTAASQASVRFYG